MTKTEYIWFLGDDDRIESDLIHDVLAIIYSQVHDGILVSAKVVGSNSVIIDDLGGKFENELLQVNDYVFEMVNFNFITSIKA